MSTKRKRKFFYAVAVGKRPAIYTSWEECKEQVDGYAGAKFKGFETLDDAQSYMKSNEQPQVTSTDQMKQFTPISKLPNDVLSILPIKPSAPKTLPSQPSIKSSSPLGGSLRQMLKSEQATKTKVTPTPLMTTYFSSLKPNPAKKVATSSNIAPQLKRSPSISQNASRSNTSATKQNSSFDDRGASKQENKNSEKGKKSKYSADDFIPLSQEQQRIFDVVMEGKNVFFTGSAGTGKSFLLKKIRRKLAEKGKTVWVTAPTGIAAVNVGGITIHRWSGIGISPKREEQMSRAWNHKKNWRDTDVLIIDEISMVSGELFDMLEELARRIRGNEDPFGNIQLICSGDFFQLPPVEKGPIKPKFCFEAKSWNKCIHYSVELKQIHRQADAVFATMLNEIRVGKCSAKTIEILNSLKQVTLDTNNGVLPTTMYAKNLQVDELNNQQLNELSGEALTFRALDSTLPYTNSGRDSASLLTLLDSLLITKEIQLKEKAQVMLLRNMSDKLINGSRGVVIGFEAISEERKSGLIKNNEIPSEWFKLNQVLPVVQFENGETRTIDPDSSEVHLNHVGMATRCQIPLKLAWSLTIHKSQGLTLDKAVMSLADIFEAGQAYVALSRLRSLQGLKLLDWKISAIKANPTVAAFYANMSSNPSSEKKSSENSKEVIEIN